MAATTGIFFIFPFLFNLLMNIYIDYMNDNQPQQQQQHQQQLPLHSPAHYAPAPPLLEMQDRGVLFTIPAPTTTKLGPNDG